MESADFEIVRQLNLEIGAKPFPLDVAKLIVERMQVAFVRDMGWEQAVQLYGKTSELRKLLSEIDRCASKTEFADLPRAEAVRRAFQEAEEGAIEIAKHNKLYSRTVQASIGILGGALGTLVAGHPGLLFGSVITAAGSTNLANLVAEKVGRLRQRNHALAYFDLSRQLPNNAFV